MHTNLVSSAVRVHPTLKNPLVLVKSNTLNYVTLTKQWVDITYNGYCQTLYTSTSRIKKLQSTEDLLLTNLPISSMVWSKERIQLGAPEKPLNQVGLVALDYFETTCGLSVNSLFKATPQTENVEETLTLLAYLLPNSNAAQLAILNQILENLPPNKSSPQLFAQIAQHQEPQPFTNFPNSVEKAIEAYNVSLTHKRKQPEQKNSQTVKTFNPPAPTICVPQPTPAQPFVIPLTNPICHHASLSTHQPSATYRVYIQDSPATATKLFRQLCLATPLSPNPKNPNCQPFPLCPVKSSIALLFYDSNPLSPTCGQPIVKSLNTHQASEEELQNFLAENQPHLSQHQRALLSVSKTTGNQSNRFNIQKEPPMLSTHTCKFCGSTFHAAGTKTIYCSPRCRIDYNAGKKFEELAEQKQKKAHAKQSIGIVRTGIKFPDGLFYKGANYNVVGFEGQAIHSAEYRTAEYYAKMYTPTKIKELFETYPDIFVGCVMAVIEDFPERD